ncbi:MULTISPECIES: Cys-Gln thioester bond-forming surface protein [Streptomyces]|uniref:Cys-Gln thioester bond-forming surface protein n=1 Tax=Streptomyces TaxID=1883 RepID=UPI000A45F090|nr:MULTISPECIES: Cys-Gln thioester bond-forming surface protein [Streptomyces]MDH6225425.1 TQXA domain-containing protein/LPXTG-motif cell wall-anchored protein [Streptomyces sp. MJP52]
MFRIGRRATTRLSAAILVAGLSVGGSLATAGVAAADDHNPAGGTLATLRAEMSHTGGATINGESVKAGLFTMDIAGGGTLQSYCIDAHTPTVSGATYQEKSWAESSLANNPDAGKIHWILKNAFPQVDEAALAKAAGITGEFTKNDAAVGTQVAIWRYSDHVRAEAKDAEAEQLADYLEKAAQSVEEPGGSLSLSAPAVAGNAGEKLGPVTVTTNAGTASVKVAGEGVKVVDASGNPVTGVANGSELYVDVAEGTPAGTAEVTVEGSVELSVGRAFTGVGVKTQTQILAGSTQGKVASSFTATWSEKETTGAVLAAEAVNNCAKGGVDVKVTNSGDEAGEVTIGGEKHTVEAGKDVTVTVPVKEDAEYSIAVTGPNGLDQTFTGILDCQTASEGGSGAPKPSTAPSPAGDQGDKADDGTNLAETGSNSATPVIAGVAIALVVVGGVTMLVLRKRKSA